MIAGNNVIARVFSSIRKSNPVAFLLLIIMPVNQNFLVNAVRSINQNLYELCLNLYCVPDDMN